MTVLCLQVVVHNRPCCRIRSFAAGHGHEEHARLSHLPRRHPHGMTWCNTVDFTIVGAKMDSGYKLQTEYDVSQQLLRLLSLISSAGPFGRRRAAMAVEGNYGATILVVVRVLYTNKAQPWFL
jgi:hypothetical protein